MSGCTAHEAMARTCEVVKMGIANVANRMCKLSCNSRGKAAEGSVEAAATTLDVTIRLLLPLLSTGSWRWRRATKAGRAARCTAAPRVV